MTGIPARLRGYAGRWIADWNPRQLMLGLALAVLFGVVLPYLNIPVVEWMAEMIVYDDPAREQLPNYEQVEGAAEWGLPLFLGLYLLPALLVDTAAGFGREGFLGVMCFGLIWWAAGSTLGFPPEAFGAIFLAVLLELFFNGGMAVYNGTKAGNYLEYGGYEGI